MKLHARQTSLQRWIRAVLRRVRIWLPVLAALALVLVTACGRGTGQTPLAGADLDCAEAARGGKLVACNEEKGVALIYFENAYGPEGLQKVDQYVLIPLRVASVEDFRAKTNWAWKHWDVWRKENIDVCDANIAADPSSVMLQLSPDDLRPAECR